MLPGPARRRVRKVVCYVVHDDQLLVFTYKGMPLMVMGVQVPAGTIESDEEPAVAAVREAREETGLDVEAIHFLGVEEFDIWPPKPGIHERHFFQLTVRGDVSTTPWQAGEPFPSEDGPFAQWTCQWIPMNHAHVVCAGFGAKLGLLRR